MPNEPLDVGIGQNPLPGGGGISMEHGKHSAPIGELDPFNENVSPAERESSKDWTEDTPTGIKEDNFDAEGSESGEGEAIERMDSPTYGPSTQPPYEV